MCGIAGIVGEPDQESVQRMTASLRHRGPDDTGTYMDHQIVLGITRLAILDLSPAGHQPMSTSKGRYWIVYNGEMYNFQEERRRLESRGHVFCSNSDTEVVLHLYQEYGMDCVHHMRGMFAFAVWDHWERRLFAARDRLGINPLLFASSGGRLVFASELKALLASGLVGRQMDHHGLCQCLLLGYVLPPLPMVSGVKSLAPGQYLTWSQGRLRVGTYWDVGSRESIIRSDADYAEARGQIRSHVLTAVKEQLVSDVPLGVFLSGGLDSAVVVAAMSSAGAGRIESFSIGFDQADDGLDETDAAAITARHFGTHHHKLAVTGYDVANQFDSFVASLDQPSVDGLNTYFASQFARGGVTVALSGLGGDELFAGYGWARRIADEQVHPAPWRSPLALGMATPVARLLPARLRWRLQRAAAKSDVLTSYALSGQLFVPDKAAYLLHPDFARTEEADFSVVGQLAMHDDPTLEAPIRRVARLDLKTFMAGRVLRDMDAVSMAQSREVRFPLIDHRLVDYAFALPQGYKYGGLNGAYSNVYEEGAVTYTQGGIKRILFDAFAADLPPNFGHRRKAGFFMPFDRWLRNDLAARVESVLKGGDTVPLFRAEGLRLLWSRWQTGRAGWGQVWLVLVLDTWYRQVLMKPGVSP